MRALAPDLVVDASGPFQVYGDPYRVVRAALARRIGYLDLADGADFVQGIAQFDAQARERGVFVLAGASSFPVLTAAVVRRLARGMTRVDAVSAGIAPSPFAGLGLNVIRAIASYCGKPVELLRDGRKAVGFGLTESRRFTVAPPGRLPLGSRRFSLVDAPDLRVLPALWPLREVWMGAGTVPEIMHRVLNLCACAVRLRLLPSLLPFARLMHWATNRLRWGEHRGGMYRGGRRARAKASRSNAFLAHDRRRRRRPVHSRDGVRGDHPELSCRQTPGAGRAAGDRRCRARRLRAAVRAPRDPHRHARNPARHDAALSPPARRCLRRAARAAAGDARSARSHEPPRESPR